MPSVDVRSALVIHDRPEEFRNLLEARFPNLRIGYATHPAEIGPALAELNPEAVFSIKTSIFAGDSHRRAIAHPSIRWVHVGGSGYEHLLPWPRKDLRVSTSVGVLARDLAETVTAGILALNGNLLAYREQQRNRVWKPLAFRPLVGQTILIIGLGAIGGWVAHNAKALGMKVIATRRRELGHPSVDRLHPPEMLRAVIGDADIVTLHLRLDDTTRGLIDRSMIAAMKRGALLINTARGAIVDEPAMIEALQSGQLGGAYLDVFAAEPLPPSSPLWTLPNVLITPHAADNSIGWAPRFAHLFADNLDRLMRGERLANELDRVF